jgi:hypothetical protein
LPFIPDCTTVVLGLELIERTPHLGVHVERLQALADAALVAGEDERPHLREESGVTCVRRRLLRQ